jgi:hypothetical protein
MPSGLIRLDDQQLQQALSKLAALRAILSEVPPLEQPAYGSGAESERVAEALALVNGVQSQLVALLEAAASAIGGTGAALLATDAGIARRVSGGA